MAGDRDEAGAIVEVAVDPATAFDVFTRDAEAWWARDRSLWGPGTTGAMRFEPGVGGRLLLDGREVGRITVWESGPRLVFDYGAPGTPSERRTEVEVRFEATGEGTTRVVLRHGGWDRDTDVPSGRQYWAHVLAGFAERSLERALLTRTGQFLDAIAAGDIDFFARNLTEDAFLIFPGPGNTYTKTQCLSGMAGHAPYAKYDVEDPRTVHLGDSAAALAYRVTLSGGERGEGVRRLVVSSVFRHENGDWRLALMQWTPAEHDNT